MIFPRHANAAVAAWLARINFSGGDVALGGPDLLQSYRESSGTPVASCALRCSMDWTSRTAEEVLRAVREPVQR